MKIILLALSVLFISGCATIQPIPYQEKEHIYNSDFDTVWAKSIEMLTQENFPVKSMDKENGLIQTDYNKNQIKHSWMSMGRYSLNLLISRVDPNNIKVIINPTYEISISGDLYQTGYGPGLKKGYWKSDDSKDKMFIAKYFKILDKKLSKI